jgi:hypothetical protein
VFDAPHLVHRGPGMPEDVELVERNPRPGQRASAGLIVTNEMAMLIDASCLGAQPRDAVKK